MVDLEALRARDHGGQSDDREALHSLGGARTCSGTLLYDAASHATHIICYATLRYATLRYATLRYATTCYAMLCYATLRYATLRHAMLCYAMLCYAMLCYAMLCYAMILYLMQCCAVLHDIISYGMVWYGTM